MKHNNNNNNNNNNLTSPFVKDHFITERCDRISHKIIKFIAFNHSFQKVRSTLNEVTDF